MNRKENQEKKSKGKITIKFKQKSRKKRVSKGGKNCKWRGKKTSRRKTVLHAHAHAHAHAHTHTHTHS